MIDPARVTRSQFEPRLGDRFEVDSDGMPLTLILGEVKAAGNSVRDGGAFSVVFVGPGGSHLEQGMTSFRHPEGTMDLFIVPIGPFGDGMGYEAIFG